MLFQYSKFNRMWISASTDTLSNPFYPENNHCCYSFRFVASRTSQSEMNRPTLTWSNNLLSTSCIAPFYTISTNDSGFYDKKNLNKLLNIFSTRILVFFHFFVSENHRDRRIASVCRSGLLTVGTEEGRQSVGGKHLRESWSKNRVTLVCL